MEAATIVYELGKWSFNNSNTLKIEIDKDILNNLYGFEPIIIKINIDNENKFYLIRSLGFYYWFKDENSITIEIFDYIKENFIRTDINRGHLIINYLKS